MLHRCGYLEFSKNHEECHKIVEAERLLDEEGRDIFLGCRNSEHASNHECKRQPESDPSQAPGDGATKRHGPPMDQKIEKERSAGDGSEEEPEPNWGLPHHRRVGASGGAGGVFPSGSIPAHPFYRRAGRSIPISRTTDKATLVPIIITSSASSFGRKLGRHCCALTARNPVFAIRHTSERHVGRLPRGAVDTGER